MSEADGTDRRALSPDFRRRSAGLILDSEQSLHEVARDSGVGERTLGLWVEEELRRRGGLSAEAGGMSTQDRLELRRLSTEIAELQSQVRVLQEMVSAVIGSRVREHE